MQISCKKFSRFFFLFLSVLGPWSLVHGPSPRAEIIEKVAAVVNKEVITLYDLDRTMAPLLAEKENLSKEAGAKIRRQMLENLIHQKLLEQEVTKAAIEVTADDLQRAIGGILQKNGITIEMLRQELSSKGISFESYKEQLRGQIAQAKFIQQNLASQVQVTPQDVQNYRRQYRGGTSQNEKIKLAWIFMPWEAGAGDKEERELVEQARELAEKARAGEDFTRLVQKYSKDKKAGQGGERTRWTNELPPELAQALQKMEARSISDPVTTPQGVYVLWLKERVESVQAGAGDSLGDEAIWQALFNERLDQEIHNYVLRLRKKAFVEIRTTD